MVDDAIARAKEVIKCTPGVNVLGQDNILMSRPHVQIAARFASGADDTPSLTPAASEGSGLSLFAIQSKPYLERIVFNSFFPEPPRKKRKNRWGEVTLSLELCSGKYSCFFCFTLPNLFPVRLLSRRNRHWRRLRRSPGLVVLLSKVCVSWHDMRVECYKSTSFSACELRARKSENLCARQRTTKYHGGFAGTMWK